MHMRDEAGIIITPESRTRIIFMLRAKIRYTVNSVHFAHGCDRFFWDSFLDNDIISPLYFSEGLRPNLFRKKHLGFGSLAKKIGSEKKKKIERKGK